MAYLNKVMIIGNVGKEPEIIRTQNTTICKFSIATGKRYKDANGEKKEETTWHNVVCFGNVSNTIERLGVHKGAQIFVEGELKNRAYTDANGNKKYTTEVLFNNFQLLSKPQFDSGNNYQNGGEGYEGGDGEDEEDADLPF